MVERVAQLRQQEREDSPGKAGRARGKATKTDAEVFADLEDWFGVKDYTLKRQHKKLTKHREYMSGTYPLALVQAGDSYEIKTIEVDKAGAIRLEGGRPRRKSIES